MTKPRPLVVVLAATLTVGLPMQTAHAQIDERLWGLSMIGVDKAWAQGFRGNRGDGAFRGNRGGGGQRFGGGRQGGGRQGGGNRGGGRPAQ